MKKTIAIVSSLVVLVVVGLVVFNFYPYVFAKHITGKILKAERVNQGDLIIAPSMGGGQGANGAGGVRTGKGDAPSLAFSFAVSIRDEKGEIHTASAEDRQWAVAEPGLCVEAKFFPYPPWQLDRAGTYYGARLLRLFDCKNVEVK